MESWVNFSGKERHTDMRPSMRSGPSAWDTLTLHQPLRWGKSQSNPTLGCSGSEKLGPDVALRVFVACPIWYNVFMQPQCCRQRCDDRERDGSRPGHRSHVSHGVLRCRQGRGSYGEVLGWMPRKGGKGKGDSHINRPDRRVPPLWRVGFS